MNGPQRFLLLLLLLLSASVVMGSGAGGVRYDNLSNNTDASVLQPIIEFKKTVDDLLINEQWLVLYAHAAKESQSAFSQERFAKMVKTLCNRMGGIETIDLKEIHLIESSSQRRVPIKNGISIVFPFPVQLNPPLAGTLAIVLCEAKSRKGPFYYWLTYVFKKQGVQWVLGSFQMKMSRLDGHAYDWYLTNAEQFAKKGQKRNALLYKMIGYQLLNLGEVIVIPEAAKEYQACLSKNAPEHLPMTGAREPDVWKTKTGEFAMTDVVPLMHPATLALQVRYLSAQKALGNSADEAERTAIFKYAIKSFPEYKDAFKHICVVSVSQAKKAQIKCYPCGKGIK